MAVLEKKASLNTLDDPHILDFGLCSFDSSPCSARTCPDCQANYANCKWKCYQDGGWQPTCAQLLTFQQQSMGNPPDPSNVMLFSSACAAACYEQYMGSYMSLASVTPLYKQTTSSECEALWKTEAALDYQLYQRNPITAGVITDPPPAFLENEIGNLSENTNADQVTTDLEKCMVCDPSVSQQSSDNKPPITIQPSGDSAPNLPSDLEQFPTIIEDTVPAPAPIEPIFVLPVIAVAPAPATEPESPTVDAMTLPELAEPTASPIPALAQSSGIISTMSMPMIAFLVAGLVNVLL